MTALTCPHCGVYARFTKVWERKADIVDWDDLAACYTCDHCERPIAAIPDMAGMILQYWPTSVKGRDFPEVPKPLAGAASQVHLCLSAGSPIGAVAVARAVVEAVAKAHGITSGDLKKKKIERLHADGHISATMRDAATEIRFAGNEAAHGDLVDERPGIEDAAEIVSLMDSILERVYQEPARVAKIRTKREARQQKAREKELLALQPGDRVDHESYGLGTVLSVKNQGAEPEADIDFGGDHGIRHLILRYAPVKRL